MLHIDVVDKPAPAHRPSLTETVAQKFKHHGVFGDLPKMIEFNAADAALILKRDIRVSSGAACDEVIRGILSHIPAMAKKDGSEAMDLLELCRMSASDPGLKTDCKRTGLAIIPDIAKIGSSNARWQLKTLFDEETPRAPILIKAFAKTAMLGNHNMTWFLPQIDDSGVTSVMLVHEWNGGVTGAKAGRTFQDFNRAGKAQWNGLRASSREHYLHVKQHYRDIEAALLGTRDIEDVRKAIRKKSGVKYTTLDI